MTLLAFSLLWNFYPVHQLNLLFYFDTNSLWWCARKVCRPSVFCKHLLFESQPPQPAAVRRQQKFLRMKMIELVSASYKRKVAKCQRPPPDYLELRLVGQFLVSFVRTMRVLSLPVRTFTLSHFDIFSCYEDPFSLLKSSLSSCINFSLGNFFHNFHLPLICKV